MKTNFSEIKTFIFNKTLFIKKKIIYNKKRIIERYKNFKEMINDIIQSSFILNSIFIIISNLNSIMINLIKRNSNPVTTGETKA